MTSDSGDSPATGANMSNRPLEGLLENVLADSSGETISIGEIVDHFGDRSFGPFLALLGMIAILPPMGAIPGVPAVVGSIIILFAVQMIFGRNHIWLPGFLKDITVERAKLKAAAARSKPWLKWIDGAISKRMQWAAGDLARYLAAVIVVLLALSMVPFEFIPFAVALPGSAIAMFGVGLMARDGLLMLVAFALAGLTSYIILNNFVFG